MSANEVHEGDIGTIFEVTVQDGDSAVDISGATTKQIIFEKPDGSTVTKDAAFVSDGSDGKIKHTIVSGDLDMAGRWQIQAYVVLVAGSWKSDLGSFMVYPNL